MKYYLGIDGGGTKTTYIVINEEKEIIYEKTSLGSAIDTYDLKTVKERLLENINEIPYPSFQGVYAGIGGITCQDDIDKICDIIKQSNKEITYINGGNDVNNALEGAVNDDGIILIAGTGAVAFGKNKGKTHRAGGYGYKEGDIGSAFYLGFHGLLYLAKVMDKRLPISDFAKALMEATHCDNFSSLAKYFSSYTREEVAQFSQIVTKYAHNEHVREIIEEAIDGVILMINTVYRECKFTGQVKFSLIGGLANADTIYKELLLKKLPKNIIYSPKKYEASYGSALLAYKLGK